MPLKSPDVYQQIVSWLQTHFNFTSFYSFIITFLIAIFRICYIGKQQSKRKVLVESLLCGTIAVASESVFEYFGMPAKLAVAFGAIIAFYGIDELRRLSKQYVETKLRGKQ